MQKALMNQIIWAVDKTYLDGLRSTLTNTINQPIYLFSTYGRVRPSALSDYEDAIQKTVHNPAESIINLYNTLQNFFDCSKHQGLPYSEQHKVQVGYNIMQRTGAFQNAIEAGVLRPEHTKSWVLFQEHFTAAQSLLRMTNNLTVQQSSFLQANIVQQVVDGVQQMLHNTLQSEPSDHEPAPDESYIHQANVATNNDILLTLMQKMAQRCKCKLNCKTNSNLNQHQLNQHQLELHPTVLDAIVTNTVGITEQEIIMAMDAPAQLLDIKKRQRSKIR